VVLLQNINLTFPSQFNKYFLKGEAVHDHHARTSCTYRTPSAQIKATQLSIKCSGHGRLQEFLLGSKVLNSWQGDLQRFRKQKQNC